MDLQVAWNLDTTVVTFSDGEKLFWISGLDVRLGYSAIDVYVAPRFGQGSCEYQAVLEHEKKHISADRALLEEYATKVEAVLTAIPWATYAEPARIQSGSEVRKSHKRQVSAALQPLLDELQEKRRRAGEELDSADGPLRFRKSCSPS